MKIPSKIKANKEKGLNRVIEKGMMEHLSMDLLVLDAGEKYIENTGNDEMVMIPLKGEGRFFTEEKSYSFSRQDVFSDKGSALYASINTDITCEASAYSEIVICRAKAKSKRKHAYVPSSQVKEKTVGKDCWQRIVVDIIDSSIDTERLIAGETYNQPGYWSSFPPHKHDTFIPDIEAKMEEIYLFMIDPPEGFGIQRLYSDVQGFDISLSISSYDVVTIPTGYHPVVSMPGYNLYYLWLLAGEDRKLMPNTDPKYAWLLKE
jgi:5-deoxy-glucuronate isomerase